MKTFPKKRSKNVSSVFCFFAAVFSLGVIAHSAHAWSEPTAAPPLTNVGAPITTTSVAQTKSGNLSITDDGAIPDTAGYSSFGITRSAALQKKSYLGLTKYGVAPWGIGIDEGASLIVGAAFSPTKTIPDPLLTIGTDGKAFFKGSVYAGGSALCQSNGINCPLSTGDNLGNHIAIQSLNLNNHAVIGVSALTAVGGNATIGDFNSNGLSGISVVGTNAAFGTKGYLGGYGYGVKGYSAVDGISGVLGQAASPAGYSGYFTGGKFVVGSGNVGIGTINPITKLDIAGDIRVGGQKLCYYTCYTTAASWAPFAQSIFCDKRRFDNGAVVSPNVYMGLASAVTESVGGGMVVSCTY